MSPPKDEEKPKTLTTNGDRLLVEVASRKLEGWWNLCGPIEVDYG